VPTDVTDEAAVQALAGARTRPSAGSTCGSIAAAVIAYGEFEKTPTDVYRQVIETNLFGQIQGPARYCPLPAPEQRCRYRSARHRMAVDAPLTAGLLMRLIAWASRRCAQADRPNRDSVPRRCHRPK